jgi:hypothetical protein
MKSFSTEDERPAAASKSSKSCRLDGLVSPAAGIYAFAAIMACLFDMIAGPSPRRMHPPKYRPYNHGIVPQETYPAGNHSMAAILIDKTPARPLSHNAMRACPLLHHQDMTAWLSGDQTLTRGDGFGQRVSTAGSNPPTAGCGTKVEQLLYAMLVVSATKRGVALARPRQAARQPLSRMMKQQVRIWV